MFVEAWQCLSGGGGRGHSRAIKHPFDLSSTKTLPLTSLSHYPKTCLSTLPPFQLLAGRPPSAGFCFGDSHDSESGPG